MPFTFAHPIAAAPIWLISRRRLHLPGLMIGTMMPDLEYFLTLRPSGTIGHTLPGVFLQGLPCGLGLLLLIQYGLAQPFLALLPNDWAQRIPSPKLVSFWRWQHLMNVGFAIVLGAISHIVWDGFTHQKGWFVQNLTVLQSTFLFLPLYKVLQYSSGILGLLALAIWLFIWSQQLLILDTELDLPKLTLWQKKYCLIMMLIVAIVTALISIFSPTQSSDTIQAIVVRGIVGAISGFCLGFGGYAIGFWATIAKFHNKI
jgi:hypothetical protein